MRHLNVNIIKAICLSTAITGTAQLTHAEDHYVPHISVGVQCGIDASQVT
ncbi:MAG: hypothetical protein K2K37_07270, partial [Muribaculaceae bacterium]|nr:hypothetical protein [Muribaculaceae bacterium]